MAKKCKNPLMMVTATIAYYMELNGIDNKTMCERLMISANTWIDRKKMPERFTLGDLSRISKILGVDVITIVGGLIPKEKGEN